jgi:hypothetical protein
VNELTTSQLLLEHYLDWQKSEGRLGKVKDFCDHIGEKNYQNFNHYLNGRRIPGEKVARRFAELFNDPRFYDAAGIPRPDPDLTMVITNWPKMSEETRRRFAEEAATYSTKPIPNDRDTAAIE